MKEPSMRYLNGQVARFYFRQGDVKNFFKFIIISEITYKNIGMALTVALPRLRKWVLRNFNVSGVNGG